MAVRAMAKQTDGKRTLADLPGYVAAQVAARTAGEAYQATVDELRAMGVGPLGGPMPSDPRRAMKRADLETQRGQQLETLMEASEAFERAKSAAGYEIYLDGKGEHDAALVKVLEAVEQLRAALDAERAVQADIRQRGGVVPSTVAYLANGVGAGTAAHFVNALGQHLRGGKWAPWR